MRIYNLAKDSNDEEPKKYNRSTHLKLNVQEYIPKIVDHRDTCPPIYDQGKIGSCTASAICCIFYHNLLYFNYKNVFLPSRLFLYYNTREDKHTVDIDNGCSLRDTLKSLNTFGVCPENLWDYTENNFKLKPPKNLYKFAHKYNNIAFFRVPQILNQLKQCLIDGYLFVFGITIYSSFESSIVETTGYVPRPSPNDTYVGIHAVCAVGYDDNKKVFIVRNSWGSNWGDGGYFYLPYDYILDSDLVFDIWTFSNNAYAELNIFPKKCILM